MPLLASCSGIQSALDPAGEEAGQVATLFWVMAGGGLIIWALVVTLSLYASRWKRRPMPEEAAAKVIFWAGVVFPVAVLTALAYRLAHEWLGYTFDEASASAPKVAVITAYEQRLPAGEAPASTC